MSEEQLPRCTVTRAARHRTPEFVAHDTTLARKSRASHTAHRDLGGQDPLMGLRVLIIDDNAAFRAAARQLLERGGFVVVAEAGDGASGLREAKEHSPDLAVVDVQLPDSDGFDVAERLCGIESRPDVILVSSLDGADFGALVAG